MKQDTLSKVNELEKKIENQEIDEKKRINWLEIATKGFTVISKIATDFDLQTFTPEVHRDRLIKKIENAHRAGYLTDDQSEEISN